jgi:SNF2 family DNA or RNA helicase
MRQAVARIWRYGQEQPCFIYRLMYKGTLEENVYEQSLKKEELFARVRGHLELLNGAANGQPMFQ